MSSNSNGAPSILLSSTGFPLTKWELLVKSNDLKTAFDKAVRDPFASPRVIQRLQQRLYIDLAVIQNGLDTLAEKLNNS